jgi:hypothetical protein
MSRNIPKWVIGGAAGVGGLLLLALLLGLILCCKRKNQAQTPQQWVGGGGSQGAPYSAGSKRSAALLHPDANAIAPRPQGMWVDDGRDPYQSLRSRPAADRADGAHRNQHQPKQSRRAHRYTVRSPSRVQPQTANPSPRQYAQVGDGTSPTHHTSQHSRSPRAMSPLY